MDFCFLRREKRMAFVGGTVVLRLMEPTIYELLHMRALLYHASGEAEPDIYVDDLLFSEYIEKFLVSGDIAALSADDRREILQALAGLARADVLEGGPTISASTPEPEEYKDLNLLYELDAVARRYHTAPHTLAREITLRQCHILFMLVANELHDQNAALPPKSRAHGLYRYRLRGASGQAVSTRGMSPVEKAKYFSDLRQREGRQPGRLK